MQAPKPTNNKKRKHPEVSGEPLPERPEVTKRRRLGNLELAEHFIARIEDKDHRKDQLTTLQLENKRPNKSTDKTRLATCGLKVRRRHSLEMQTLVIFLRYGSLSTDAQPWLRASEVFRRTGVKVCSQQLIVKRWRERGFVVVYEKRRGSQPMLSREEVEWLIDPETLRSMAHLSLRDRLPIIMKHLGLPSFSEMTLWNYYKKNGIGFKRPDYKYWKSLAEERELRQKQLEFAGELGTILKDEAYDEVIYIDETTFNLWQKMSRAWVRPGMKL